MVMETCFQIQSGCCIAQVTIIDVLRRAGADVTVASVESGLQVHI